MASYLRPLARAAPRSTLASSQARPFARSAARRVRLPHQEPSPTVAFLERFSPVNHKVQYTADGRRKPEAYTKYVPTSDVRKIAVCLVVFAAVTYAITRPADQPFLDELEYKAFPLEWVEVLGDPEARSGRYKTLTIRLPDDHPMVKGNLKSESAPYHIMVKDPNLQIERPYTIFPPPPHVTSSQTQLTILVKKEDAGEVSRYIHSLKRFDWPEIRGPIKTQTEDVRVGGEEGGEGWSLRGWDRVVMISGGTGVAPFFQLLHSLIPPERVVPVPPPTDLPTLTLIHASPSLTLQMVQEHLPEPDRLPARLELVDLSPARVTADALASVLLADGAAASAPTAGAGASVLSKVKALFSGSSSSPAPAPTPSPPSDDAAPADDGSRPTPLSPTARTLFLVSGPDGMISAVTGAKGTSEIGGILGELGFGAPAEGGARREVRRFWNTPAAPLAAASGGTA